MARQIKVVIFDMDGVLVDSEWQYHLRIQSFLRENQVELPETVMAKLVGMSWDNMVSAILSSSGVGWSAEEFTRRHSDYADRVGRLRYDSCVFPDTKDTLAALRRAGYPLGLASSSEGKYVFQMIKDCGFQGLFQHVLSHEDIRRSKPDPEIYLEAANRFRVRPQDCAAIEDSPYGIESAKRAGMTVIAKRPLHYELDQSAADAQIDDLSELPSLLEQLSLVPGHDKHIETL